MSDQKDDAFIDTVDEAVVRENARAWAGSYTLATYGNARFILTALITLNSGLSVIAYERQCVASAVIAGGGIVTSLVSGLFAWQNARAYAISLGKIAKARDPVNLWTTTKPDRRSEITSEFGAAASGWVSTGCFLLAGCVLLLG